MLEHDWADMIWPHGLGCLGPFDCSYDLVWCEADLSGGPAVWLQQGPVHVGSFLLMLMLLMLLQRRCSQSPQPVQRTEFDVTFFEHIGQK